MISSRSYLIRALYDWIVDNQWAPHVVIDSECPGVVVPKEHAEGDRVVINVSPLAIRKMLINYEAMEFDARFGERSFHVWAPIRAVLAIYAQENGKGMVFEGEDVDEGGNKGVPEPSEGRPKHVGKPHLKVVK